ncbi:hypothetical protein GCM10029963_50440 [Micromonospora andamanensis]
MRRRVAGVSVVAVAASLVVGAPAGAADEVRSVTREGVTLQVHRAAKAVTPVKGTGATRSDFDGDGVDDIAASADPFEYTRPESPAGLVVVRYSSAPHVDYFTSLISSGGGELRFGEVLAAGDFNGDGYDDLAMGDLAEYDPTAKVHAGGVWVVPGSGTGLAIGSAKHFSQSSPGVPGDSEKETGSARRWPPVTSTATVGTTWRSGRTARRSAPSPRPAR